MAPYTTLVMHKQEQLKEGGSAAMSLVPYVLSRYSPSLTSQCSPLITVRDPARYTTVPRVRSVPDFYPTSFFGYLPISRRRAAALRCHSPTVRSLLTYDASRDRALGPEALYEYDLFAVVCHEGGIDNGHYTCFARSQDEVRSVRSCLPARPLPAY